VLQGWRRSELLASQVLCEGVTHDPVPTFDGSQLLRNSSYVSKKRYVSSHQAEAGLIRIVHDPQCAACRQSRQIQEKAQTQGYSGFGLKSQTATPKSAQLASRAPSRAELLRSFRRAPGSCESWSLSRSTQFQWRPPRCNKMSVKFLSLTCDRGHRTRMQSLISSAHFTEKGEERLEKRDDTL